MFVEIVNAASTAVNTYELSKKGSPLIGRILRRIKDGKLNVAIFGAGGTGKTTLGRTLSGNLSYDDILRPYEMSIRSEEFQLDSKSPSSILVFPGQSRYWTEWDEGFLKIATGQIDLIINVVAYGYHSFGRSGYISYQTHPDFQAGMSPQQFIETYTKNRRDREELELLNALIPHISVASKKKVVMVSLVTKQDLWWTDRYVMDSHYKNGDYARAIQSIASKLGSNNFTHEYLSLSLIGENFRSYNDAGNDEILAPVCQGYEQKIQAVNLNQLFNFIERKFDLEIGG